MGVSMARRPEQPSGTDKAKVRVFFAEVEGNNESVQEALKTMVSAMSRPVRVISETKPNGETNALPRRAEVEEADESALSGEEEEIEVFSEETTSSSVRRPRGTGKKVDRNAGLELVPDLEFRPDGRQSLKAFVDDKNPKNDIETILATVHYMQHVMRLAKIGPSHVMTAFKEVGKAVPADLRAGIRHIKRSRMLLNFTDIEDVRMTTQGDNFVEHDMGKSE